MKQEEIEELLHDAVTEADDDTAYLGYQATGIRKLAELIAEQNRRISELETKIADLAAEKRGHRS